MSNSIQELKQAVLEFDDEKAGGLAQRVISEGLPIMDAVESMGDALRELGVKFQAMEVFLPELLLATDAFKEAMRHFEPELKKQASGIEGEAPKIVMATVKGDVHGVGKDMVSLMLSVEGFIVKDLGVDVDSETIIKCAEEIGAQVIGLSAFMSTTIPHQKEVIDFLNAKGLREKYKVMIGGGSTTPEWAEQIGADGWSKDALQAVALAKRLTGK